MDWYKENKALQAELKREYPAVAELINELGNKLADEKKAAGHWMEQSCKDHNKAEKLEQQLAHKQEQCDQLAHEVLELEQQLSRYQGAVEVEGVYIRVADDNGYEATAIEVNWNPDVIGQQVRVLVYPQADKGAVALKEVE